MLDLEAVQSLLAQRRYRPDWAFRAYLGDSTRQIMIQIEGLVEDSYNPGAWVPLDIRSPVPTPALESSLDLDLWLVWRLGQVEIHEAAEWYRRPGKSRAWIPVFDPHRDGADRDEWPIIRRG